MRHIIKQILTGLALTLLFAAGTASARNLSISNQNIRATWTSLEFEAESVEKILCPVTLEGSFHSRTIAKILGELLGWITRAVVKQESCIHGIMSMFNGTERFNGTTTPNTLPWHITYQGFDGRLPEMSAIRILLHAFRFGIRDTSGLCAGEYGRIEDGINANANLNAGRVTSLAFLGGSNRLTLFRRDGGIFCPGEGRLVGPGEVFLLGTTNRITITLI